MPDFNEIWDVEAGVRLGICNRRVVCHNTMMFLTTPTPLRPARIQPAAPFPGSAGHILATRHQHRTLNLDIKTIINAHNYDGTDPDQFDEIVNAPISSTHPRDRYETWRNVANYDMGRVTDYQDWLIKVEVLAPYMEQYGWVADDPRETYVRWCDNTGRVPAGHNLRTSATVHMQRAADRMWRALEGYVDVDQDDCLRAAERLLSSTSPNDRSREQAVAGLIRTCRNIERVMHVPMFGRALYNIDFRSVERNYIPDSARRILGDEPDWDTRDLGPWTGGTTPAQPVAPASGPKRYIIHPQQPGRRAINLEG